jgi:hypothetical protein
MRGQLQVPHCRTFPPRVSHEELKARTTEVMRKNGANFHFQAALYEAASHEVVGSRDPAFCTLQPKMKLPVMDEAWAAAYEFAFEFLRAHAMELTPSAVTAECGRAGPPASKGRFKRIGRDAFFSELIAIQRTAFQDQVDRFARGE